MRIRTTRFGEYPHSSNDKGSVLLYEGEAPRWCFDFDADHHHRVDSGKRGYDIPKNSFMHGCQAEEESSKKNKRDVAAQRSKRGAAGKKAKRSWIPWR